MTDDTTNDPTSPAAPPQPMTNDEVVAAVEEQLTKLDLPNMDSAKAKDWLKGFRLPLASLTTNALVALVHSREQGVSDDALRAMYRGLTPAELNAVMAANADTLDKIASEGAREAAIWRVTRETLTAGAASYIMSGLLQVLGVPKVKEAIAPAEPKA